MKNNSSSIFEKGMDAIKNLWSPTAEKSRNTDEELSADKFDEVKTSSQLNSLQEPTITSLTSDTGSVIGDDRPDYRKMKFMELRATMRKKGLKYKKTDTKEILLRTLLDTVVDDIFVNTPESVISQAHSVQSMTPSISASTQRAKSSRKDTVNHYGLRSSDVHYSLRSHDSGTPARDAIEKSKGKRLSLTNEVGHNIDDDFVHYRLTTFHEKRHPHHRRSSPGKGLNHLSDGSATVSSGDDLTPLPIEEPQSKVDIEEHVNEEEMADDTNENNEGYEEQQQQQLQQNAFETQMEAAESFADREQNQVSDEAEEEQMVVDEQEQEDNEQPVAESVKDEGETAVEQQTAENESESQSSQSSQSSGEESDDEQHDEAQVNQQSSEEDGNNDEKEEEAEDEEEQSTAGDVVASEEPVFDVVDDDSSSQSSSSSSSSSSVQESESESSQSEESASENDEEEEEDGVDQENNEDDEDAVFQGPQLENVEGGVEPAFSSSDENQQDEESVSSDSDGSGSEADVEDDEAVMEEEDVSVSVADEDFHATFDNNEEHQEQPQQDGDVNVVVEMVEEDQEVDEQQQSSEDSSSDEEEDEGLYADLQEQSEEQSNDDKGEADIMEIAVDEDDSAHIDDGEENEEDEGEWEDLDEDDEEELESGDDDEEEDSQSQSESAESEESSSEEEEELEEEEDQSEGDSEEEFPFPPSYPSPIAASKTASGSAQMVDLVSSDDEEEEVVVAPVVAVKSAPPTTPFVFVAQPIIAAPTPVVSAAIVPVVTAAPSVIAPLVVAPVPSVVAAVPELTPTAQAAMAAFGKLGNTFAALVAAPVSAPTTLSEAEYELLRSLLERSRPATLAPPVVVEPVSAPVVVPVVSEIVPSTEPVVLVSVPQSKRKAVSFPEDVDESPRCAEVVETIVASTPSAVSPGKSLSFATQVAVTIPTQPQAWSSRDSFLPSPYASPVGTPAPPAKQDPVVLASGLVDTSKATSTGFGSRRLVSTPYSKFRASVPFSVDANDENAGGVSTTRRLPTPYHSRQPVAPEEDENDDILRLTGGRQGVSSAVKEVPRKRSFFDSESGRDSFGGEMVPDVLDSGYLGGFSAAKRRSVEGSNIRYSLPGTPFSSLNNRMSFAGTPSFSMTSSSPAAVLSPAGSGVTAPITAEKVSTLSIPFHIGTAPVSRIPTASSTASRSSYLPKFTGGATRFSSFEAPIIVADAVVPSKGPRESLSYIQRRRLQRQSVGTASAVVAKKILETLGSITTGVEQERKRPLALTWNQTSIQGDGVTVSASEQAESDRRRGPPSKAATIGPPTQIQSSSSASSSISLSTSAAPQIVPSVVVGKDSAGFGFNATKSTAPESGAKPVFQSRIPSLGGSKVAPVPPAVIAVQKTNANISTTVVPADKTVAAQPTRVMPSSDVTVDSEFVFNEPMEVSGVDQQEEGGESSLLGKRGANDSSSIKYAFSPPNQRRKSASGATLTSPAISSTPAATTKKDVEVSAPVNNIWAASSINDGVKCPTCLSKNKKGATRCASCESPIGGAAPAATVPVVTATPAAASTNIWAASSLGAFSKCPTCMSQNKKDATKCLSCEGPMGGTQTGSISGSSGAAPSTSSTGGFTFGAPVAATSAPALTSGFSFGASTTLVTETVKPATTGFTFGASTTETVKPAGTSGFSFGAPAATIDTNKSSASTGFQFGAAAPPVEAVKQAGFSFGAPSAAPVVAPAPVAVSTFGGAFGASALPITAPATAAPSASGFSFGKAPSVVEAVIPPSLKTKTGFGALDNDGAEEQQSKKRATISWGSDVKDATVTSLPTASSAFAFGTTPAATIPPPTTVAGSTPLISDFASTPSPFGGFPSLVEMKEERKTPSFSFGAAPVVAASTAPTSSFSFGGANPVADVAAFPKPVAFAPFSGLPSIPEEKTAPPAAISTFGGFGGFGAPSASVGQPIVKQLSSDSLSGAASPFTFGATPVAPVSAPAVSTFMFGSAPAATPVVPSSAFMFGGPAASAAPVANKPVGGAFSFGAPAQVTAPASNGFMNNGGSMDTGNGLPAFGAAPSTNAGSMFGGFGAAPATTSNPFGAAPLSATSNGNPFSSSFGAPSVNNGFGQQPSSLPPSTSSTPSFGFPAGGGMSSGFGAPTPSAGGPFGGMGQQPPGGGNMFGGNSSGGFGAPSPVNFGGGPFGSNSGSSGNLAGMSGGSNNGGGGGSTGFSLGVSDNKQAAGAAAVRRKVKAKRPGV